MARAPTALEKRVPCHCATNPRSSGLSGRPRLGFFALWKRSRGGGPCNVLHFTARHHPAGLASSGGLGIARRSRHCPVVPASRGGPDVVLRARHHPAGLALSGGLGIARQGLRQELGGYWTDMVLENHVLAVTASCQDGATDPSFLRAVKAQVTIFSRFYCSHYAAIRWFLSTISVQKRLLDDAKGFVLAVRARQDGRPSSMRPLDVATGSCRPCEQDGYPHGKAAERRERESAFRKPCGFSKEPRIRWICWRAAGSCLPGGVRSTPYSAYLARSHLMFV